ncbi:MAG: hypothetical protein IT454_15850 [Planctomycetes bacterium]|nr:hypothetical protein [Planctomycetota bacterium]
MSEPQSLERYTRHLEATGDWLVRSIEQGRGGSCAHFSPATGWSRPYPETTGYAIPTLLELGLRERALDVGRWLCSIQNEDGSWNGGLYPPKKTAKPSVFNTGQILDGLTALHRARAGVEFVDAAHRGARWLVSGMARNGLWAGGDYRASETPSYYSHVLWPMLETWRATGDDALREAAERGIATILARARGNGWFSRSGFTDEERAFTHTIAYTLRGLLECSRLLGAWDDIGAKTVPALERMLRKTELLHGRLPGELDCEWRAVGDYECLTGHAQTAINLLLWEERERDLRIVNGAAKLVDRVCATQTLRHPLAGLRGAVAGSWPIWGRYMTLRYPNWAAKYHCDALVALSMRLASEHARLTCASS